MFKMLNGPLNKTLYTQELELVTKCILHAPNILDFHIEKEKGGKSSLHIDIGNLDINLSDLFKKANFTHVELDANDTAKFNPYSNYYSSYDNDNDNDDDSYDYHYPNYDELSTGELHAIQNYTGSAYQSINSLLHDKPGISMHGDYAKNIVLNTVVLASGLNKIMPSTEYQYYDSYRGEHSTSYSEILHRIDLVKKGGGITDESAFMSTSVDPHVAQGFSGNCLIVFDSVYGKNISNYSLFPGEQEFLLPPGDILWKSHEYRPENNQHVFHAQVVAPLVPENEVVKKEDIFDFKKLLGYAKSEGISDDFITDFNWNLLSNTPEPVTSKPIKAHHVLHDVHVNDLEIFSKLTLNDVFQVAHELFDNGHHASHFAPALTPMHESPLHLEMV